MSETNLSALNESYSFVLSSYSSYVKPNDVFTITMVLSNTLPYDLTNISAMVNIGVGATFAKGTLRIDGVSYSSVDVTSYFSIPKTLTSGGDPITVQFWAVADDDAYDPIYFIGNLKFTVQGIQASDTTNQLKMEVVNNSVTIKQTTSKSAVISGQTLTYTFRVTNDGNMTQKNVVFTDVLPAGETFVEGTVKINGKTYANANPNSGFSMSNISADTYSTVKFDVTID